MLLRRHGLVCGLNTTNKAFKFLEDGWFMGNPPVASRMDRACVAALSFRL